jgi:hypothetical protein
MGIYLTHLICAGWAKGLKTSVVAFDITQFFPSLNHDLLLDVLKHQGFSVEVCNFFSSYLSNRSTQFLWNGILSPLFNATISIGQGSTLSPILSVLYIALIMHGFSLHSKNLGCTILSYVDDGTIVTQPKSLMSNLEPLKEAYRIVDNLLHSFGLVLEHDKSKVFHFTRAHHDTLLSLALDSSTMLVPKLFWRYLGFYFDKSLSFKEHVRYYSTKAFSMVLAMRMLGNSSRGLTPLQKHLLY